MTRVFTQTLYHTRIGLAALSRDVCGGAHAAPATAALSARRAKEAGCTCLSEAGTAAPSAEQGGPLVGAMFWGWGGEGRPREKRDACSAGGAKAFFEQGDDLLSDPPHETQGWYSVYDADLSTKVVLRAFAESLATYVPGG